MLENEPSLQQQLGTITQRSPMDSDTIQRELSLDSFLFDPHSSDSINFDSLNLGANRSDAFDSEPSKSHPLDSLVGDTQENLRLPTEEEFWSTGRILRKIFLIALFLSVAGYGGYHYYFNYFPAGIAIKNEREISRLIGVAKKQVNLSQLSVPKGNNAYETLTKVLSIEPNHPVALQMMATAASSYEKRALDYIAKKDFVRAQWQLTRGFNFSKKHKGLLEVQALLNKKLSKLKK
jgi:hypothetical protein